MRNSSPITRRLLSLSMLDGVGPATLRALSEIELSDDDNIDVVARRSTKISKALEPHGAWERAQERADEQIRSADLAESEILSWVDSAYPELLRKTKDAPYFLFMKGQFHSDPLKSVAIIGTRGPTDHGQKIADRIARFFVDNHWSVVSGLALGVDATAHRATLDARGHTVAVLAHGLQTIAPTSHRELAQQILEAGGALVSEYPFGTPPLPTQFVKRDRTQAGLAQGVVMIQSDLKGGSLHASRAALEYGRWLAAPFPTDRDQSANEPKIQANLTLSSGSEQQKRELLRCSTQDLARLIILRQREDYPELLSKSIQSDFTSPLLDQPRLL